MNDAVEFDDHREWMMDRRLRRRARAGEDQSREQYSPHGTIV
jgi:hypothetical protein